MRISADCIPCLMKRVLFQSRLDGRSDDYASTEAALKELARYISPEKSSAEVAAAVHAAAYSRLTTDDPYRKLKVEADRIADGLAGRAQEYVNGSGDRIKAAFEVSVAGNIMDFGSSGEVIDDPSEFEPVFGELLKQGLGVYDENVINPLILGAKNIVYMFDNCGESQLDRILIRELRSRGKHVTGIVRGRSILNDVTAEDAVRSGLDTDLDSMVTTGKFYIGMDWKDIPEETRNAVAASDVIIAKGMANYEAVSDETVPIPIIHAFRVKCGPVSDSCGISVGTNAVFAVLNGRRMEE